MSPTSLRSERGAMVIMVAVALLGLALFSALALDMGILWAARAQAQNAADAGALAAAVNLENNPDNGTAAQIAARKFASANSVWSQNLADADILVQTGLTCPPGSGGGGGCVRVDVMRGGTDRFGTVHTNYLPTIFARLAGISTQAINATATAQVVSGNSVTCIKPWIVADKWTDTTPDTDSPTDVPSYYGDSWDRDDTFTTGLDTYTAGNGFNPTFDSGYRMPLKPGAVGAWSSGWAMEIDFGQTGSRAYQDTIEGCPSYVPTVGIFNPTAYAAAHPGDTCNAQNDATDPEMGCLSVKTGMSQGPTSNGVTNLVAADTAHWTKPGDPDYVDDPTTHDDDKGYVISSCMNANPPNCHDVAGNPLSISPRIVPIAIFDTTQFVTENCSGSGCVARVVNLAGFFIEGMCSDVYSPSNLPTWCGSPSDANKIVIGRFMKFPGTWSGNGGPTTSSFAQAVRLVR